MIFSNISCGAPLTLYPPAIQAAIRYATTTDFATLADGRQEIDGDKMFANLFHLTSKPVGETYPELHKKYVDVQFWISGEEQFGVAPADGIGALVKADADSDLYFYQDVKNESFVHAWAGCYAVFFPQDAHRPGVCRDRGPQDLRKVVVKVSVALL